MHPQNILKATREPWRAIDPKGVVGDPLYDVATFVNSAPDDLDGPARGAFVARRAAQVSDALGHARDRPLAWAFSHAVLAGWWTFEDHAPGWERAFALAERLASPA